MVHSRPGGEDAFLRPPLPETANNALRSPAQAPHSRYARRPPSPRSSLDPLSSPLARIRAIRFIPRRLARRTSARELGARPSPLVATRSSNPTMASIRGPVAAVPAPAWVVVEVGVVCAQQPASRRAPTRPWHTRNRAGTKSRSITRATPPREWRAPTTGGVIGEMRLLMMSPPEFRHTQDVRVERGPDATRSAHRSGAAVPPGPHERPMPGYQRGVRAGDSHGLPGAGTTAVPGSISEQDATPRTMIADEGRRRHVERESVRGLLLGWAESTQRRLRAAHPHPVAVGLRVPTPQAVRG